MNNFNISTINFPRLEKLELWNCSINSASLAHISTFTCLKSLNIAIDDPITGETFSCITRLKHLQNFSISYPTCDENVIEPIIAQLHAIEEIEIYSNVQGALTDNGLQCIISGCPKLTSVTLGDANDNQVYLLAKHLPKLHKFHALDADIAGEAVEALLKGCTNLQYLYLPRFNENFWNLIADNAPQLKGCDVSGYGETLVDSSITYLVEHCKVLTDLDIGGRIITDDALFSIADKLPHIKQLVITGYRSMVTNDGVIYLASRCHNLQIFELEGINITDAALHCIAQHCPNLTTISLRKTLVTESGIQMLAACKRIESIETSLLLSAATRLIFNKSVF